MSRDLPPGQRANVFSVQLGAGGRVMIPIRSRGMGTYILAVDRPIGAPRLQRVMANGAAGAAYDFSVTGRPRTNWLVWHLDSNNAAASFNVAFNAGQPGQSVRCELWLAPPGTPRPAGAQWQPSDWMRHSH